MAESIPVNGSIIETNTGTVIVMDEGANLMVRNGDVELAPGNDIEYTTLGTKREEEAAQDKETDESLRKTPTKKTPTKKKTFAKISGDGPTQLRSLFVF